MTKVMCVLSEVPMVEQDFSLAPGQRALVVIPARAGATRLPDKPLKRIQGVPMIERVWQRACAIPRVRVVVATDDLRILQVIQAAGGDATLTSSSCRSGTDRVAEVARRSSARCIVNCQGDEPFLEPMALDALITVLEQDPALPMATLAAPLTDPAAYGSPHVVKVVCDDRGNALYFSRAPIPCQREGVGVPEGALQHLGVYAFQRDTLLALTQAPESRLERLEKLEQLRALGLGLRIRVVQTAHAWGSIDTPEDLERAQVETLAVPWTSLSSETPDFV